MSDMYEELFGEKPEENGELTEKEKEVNVNNETVNESVNEAKEEKPFSSSDFEYHYKGTGEKENLYGNSSQYNGYSSQQSSQYASQQSSQYASQQSDQYNSQYSAYSQQSAPQYSNPYSGSYNPYGYTAPPVKPKKEKKKFSTGFVAFMLVLCILLSSALGFGGAMLYTHLKVADAEISTNGAMIVNKVDIDEETAQTLTDKSTSQITEEVADSVVEITTEVMSTNSFYGQYISQGAGSGVIISSDGYIVTNNHVIDGASSITVTLRDETTYPATLVGTDSIVDVALLKIDATNLKAATFGDSDKLKVGDKAVAIGNPLGQLGGTVTDGIISALDRDVVIDDETMNLLQTDTAINPGNSGGGLFDGQGALVGVVVAKSSGEEIEGLGFAIPINDVIDILDDLKEYGYVRGRVSMGVQLIDLSNEMYAMYYYGNDEAGCYVYSVEFDSAAYKAGIQQGDRIVSVDGKAITSSSEVEEALDGKSVGDKVKLELERGSKTATIELELGEYVPEKNAQIQQNQSNNDIFNPFG
ncbi:MAG: trypsin-like peptidase domain-containing protein [Ruminococcus sp.]|nr:trypsin-like peptidase domain-containing protein [Ruminococcus sp.]